MLRWQVTTQEIILFFLACYGMAATIKSAVYMTILDRKPFSCILCSSFWASFVLICAKHYVSEPVYSQLIILPLATAGAVYSINKFVTGEY